jgi:peptide chain release factor 2
MADPSFWDQPDKAHRVIAEINQIKAVTVPYTDLQKRFQDLSGMWAEVKALNDPEMDEVLIGEYRALMAILDDLEIKRMLSHPLDHHHCYLSINAGAGGTESCDWAQMLSRMYQRFAQQKGYQVEVIDFVDGEVAGIKSVTLKISGPYAYGYCKAEKGVHRLVRISPFDANAKRHTSFASVDVSPEIEGDIAIEIRPEDLKIDTYRASGAGGQHVNKTESAVRITHLPTKIVVSCQSERSQLQNKETCLKMLKSKLYEKELQEREDALKALSGEKKEIAWGSQIRSYVFQPYTLVKDARTKYETSNVQAVMDGDIEEFIKAYLKEFGSSA